MQTEVDNCNDKWCKPVARNLSIRKMGASTAQSCLAVSVCLQSLSTYVHGLRLLAMSITSRYFTALSKHLKLGQDGDELFFNHASEGGAFQGQPSFHQNATLPSNVAGCVHIVTSHHAHCDTCPLVDSHCIWHLLLHWVLQQYQVAKCNAAEQSSDWSGSTLAL